MSIYTSPHDNPLFGPPPSWEKAEHCSGENTEIDENKDEDNQEHCSEDEYCTCSCEECVEAVKYITEYDKGPEYNKYSGEDEY